MLMDIAHEQAIAILRWEGICQVDPCTTMRRQVGMVTNRFDVVVDMRVHVGAALFGVNATLDHMKQVWDHTTCCESLSLIIEVESPWVRQSAGIHFKFFCVG